MTTLDRMDYRYDAVVRLRVKNEMLREALENIRAAANDESRDGDAIKMATQMAYIASIVDDALKLWAD